MRRHVHTVVLDDLSLLCMQDSEGHTLFWITEETQLLQIAEFMEKVLDKVNGRLVNEYAKSLFKEDLP